VGGHIDNASELRDALGGPGSLPLEDLIALGYRRWGRGLPGRLRGDFVVLIWDRERSEGLLARDQLGVRSLYLHDRCGSLSFATEIRPLLTMLACRPPPDPVGVASWIAIASREGSGTLYAGIRRLEPGSLLWLDSRGVREEPYWKPRFREPLDLPISELAEEVRESVSRAVARRLAGDGLTAVLMSGGLDSSSIAAVAASSAPPGALAAYSAEFPDHPAVDESVLIAQLRSTLGLGGMTAEVRAGGLLASALQWSGAWELPLASWGEFWAGPLLGAAHRAGAQVVLGGDGGDELFDCRAYLMADRLLAARPDQAFALARELPGAGQRPSRRDLALAAREYGLIGAIPYGPHECARRLRARRGLPGWLRDKAAQHVLASSDPLAWKRLDGPRWWAYDAHVLTVGVERLGVFENHRRRASSAGLESRHPLFDLELLELGLRLPPRASFDRFLDRPVLRAAMAGLVPDAVRLRRQKALFDSLLVDSLSGPDGTAIRRLLSSPRAELGAYVELADVRSELLERKPDSGAAGFRWMYQIWRLATAECWLRAQADGGTELLADELQAPEANVVLRPASDYEGTSEIGRL
jgi:asparagine synthase (glutamine-hydrolysing)